MLMPGSEFVRSKFIKIDHYVWGHKQKLGFCMEEIECVCLTVLLDFATFFLWWH